MSQYSEHDKASYFSYLVSYISKKRGITEAELMNHWKKLSPTFTEEIYDSYPAYHMLSFPYVSSEIEDEEKKLQET
jgi:hypothetical protein